MSELKHVGRIISTGKKCMVAYRTIPGDAYNCLIIPTESLQDEYHDALVNLVEGNTAQSSYEFAEALARTNFSDGSIMLSVLHTQGKLIKVPTDNVEMLPRPGVSIVLSELNQIIAQQRGISIEELSIQSPAKQDEILPSVIDEQIIDSVPVERSLDDTAKFYRSQADKLSKEAAEYRRLAEELVPTIKRTKAKTKETT